MQKKPILLLLPLFFYSSFHIAYAGISINEVELAPTTERFIELYNSGDSAVDLTDWYIQRKTATGTTFSSLVSKTNFQGKSIPSHGYFLISRTTLNNSDIVVDNLTLTDSNTIQIKNADEEVLDKVGWGSAADCENPCVTNPADGQSIQEVSGSWIVGVPSPKAANGPPDTDSNNNSGNGTGANDSGSSSAGGTGGGGVSSAPSQEPEPFKAQILTKSIVFTGIPFTFQAKISGGSGLQSYGKYFWNFGDGDSKEARDAYAFNHTYPYPGEYTVSLEYFSNYYSETPDATAKINIKAVSATVSISKVGTADDFFIELSNDATYDIDISGWALSSQHNSYEKKFVLPKNTILGSRKKITLSPVITSFTAIDAPNLKLFTSSGQMVFDYGASIVADRPGVDSIDQDGTESIKSKTDVKPAAQSKPPVESQDLQAAVIESGHPYIFTSASVIFIGVSAGAVYFIRRRKGSSSMAEDFKILDE